MAYPAITATYAALLALVYMALSAWVVVGRGTYKTNHGDGGIEALQRRIRAHANFIEYVPLILLLATFLELGGTRHTVIHALLLPLLVARLLHPIGMVAADNTPQQYGCRGVGALVTWLVLIVAAVLLLLRIR